MTHAPSSHEIRALSDAEIDAVAGGVVGFAVPSGILTAYLNLSPLFVPGNPVVPVVPGNPVFVSSPQSLIIQRLFVPTT
jgi:hypothetical protein